MVKLRFLLIAVLMLVASTQMYAGWRVVVDKNCIKIVSSNLAAQKLIEEQHNARLDTIAAKQQKVGSGDKKRTNRMVESTRSTGK